MNKYDPNQFNDDDLMSALKEEEKITTGSRDRHDVKLEKEGEIWHIRFLPIRVGPRNLFFYRVAQHWINKRPHFCEKITPPESGGDENAQCELCDLAAQLSEHRIKDISTLGYKSTASQQWLTYCLVWSKKIPGQDLWEPQGDDVWTPYKFWLNKTLFEELREYYVRQREKRRDIVDSILNPDHGFDFYVKRSNNKLTLQKDDPRTIFPDGFGQQEKQDLMDHIFSQISLPTYRPLSPEEMEAARIKLEDAANKLEMGLSMSKRGSNKSQDADGDNVDMPPQRMRRETTNESIGQKNRASLTNTGLRRMSNPPPPAPRSVPSARPTAKDDDDDLPFDEPAETTPTPPPPPPSPSSRLRQARPPVQAQSPVQTQKRTVSTVDDEDSVTDEASDSIPPQDGFSEDDTPPTPVAKVQNDPPRPTSKLSERLRGAIQRTQQ